MIRKIQYIQHVWIKTSEGKYKSKQHMEKHLVTRWYFLFIPIFKFSKVIDSNL